MYLVCTISRSAINIKSMRIFMTEAAVHTYFKSGSAYLNGISKYGMRVYYFNSLGAPAKRVTDKFKDSFNDSGIIIQVN